MRISDWSSDVCSSDLALGLGASLAKKTAQHIAAFISQNAARHNSLVIQLRAGMNTEHAAACARLGIGRTVNDTVQAGVQHGSHAHGARDRKSTRPNSSH